MAETANVAKRSSPSYWAAFGAIVVLCQELNRFPFELENDRFSRFLKPMLESAVPSGFDRRLI